MKRTVVLALSSMVLVASTLPALAESCTVQHASLVKLGSEIKALQTQQQTLASSFDRYDAARASARSDLANINAGLISGDMDALTASLEHDNEAAEAARQQLDQVNISLLEKAEEHGTMVATFNKSCVK